MWPPAVAQRCSRRLNRSDRVAGPSALTWRRGWCRKQRVDIARADLPHVEMHQMDAVQLDFADASFDRVLCGFALFFFPEPQRALNEFLRALKPGGRVVLTTWAADDPFFTWLKREFRAALPPQAPSAAQPPEALSFDTPERLTTALLQTGFSDIQVSSEDGEFVYANEEEWWSSLWSHGIRGFLERLEPQVLDDVKHTLCDKVQEFKQSDGVHIRMRALFAVGNKS